ncbi:hypothetical protein ABW20_dc0105903 [Dactylellina cionopaga]|nr:hypothetical protein ABW20_dc0105903 [Dactylellina cionopaga]
MDFLKNFDKKPEEGAPSSSEQPKKEGGGLFDQAQGFLNNAAGGGAKGEKKEDGLDKGIDYVQEKFLGQGAQNNESAVEQAKDEQISDFIRNQYKKTTGSDFPIKDNE